MARERSGISSIRTVGTFLRVGTCSEALCNVLDRAFGHRLEREEHAAMPLAAGIMQYGYQCGLIWGAVLAAGAQAHRLLGPGPRAETGAVVAAQRLVDSFRARYQDVNCLELTDTDWHKSAQVMKYFIRGGTIRCLGMAARYAPQAFGEIDAVLSKGHLEVPPPPVSCAAMVARKMGVSEMHAAMAAGLAGGIGLSGGACGALGAAIWIVGLRNSEEGTGKVEFRSPKAVAAVDRFLECTDFDFTCSEIVGRGFEDVEDHAAYLRAGGCAEIIEVLAAE